jgi:hypothetical protein
MCLAAAEPGAALHGPSWDAVYGRTAFYAALP